ncbi:MAG: hypothetical protein K2V38_05460 [Gemmataceae bacterium]|nr:hypothetical protein [Gemmataceae bacterium]
MSEPITVRCGCCGGTGRRALPAGDHLDTLLRLRALGREAYGAELARDMGCTNEAMCNRLAYLEGLGLATSRVQGRKRLFRATVGGAP